MKQILPFCQLLALLLMVAIGASAQNEHVLGYCRNDLPEDMQPVYIGQNEQRISAAICLPAEKMMRYKGCRLTKIRFAVLEGFKNVSVWIRTSLTTSSKVVQSVAEVADGWNEVVLNKEYTIDGSDLYVGYTATQPAGFAGILAYDEGNARTSWLAVDNDWNDYHDQLGILFIQAIAEGDAYDNDMAMMALATDKNTYKVGETMTVTGTVVNTGTIPLEGYRLHISIDGGDGEEWSEADRLEPEQTATFTRTLTLSSLAEGHHEVVASIGSDDDNAANGVLREAFYAYETAYPRTSLLEHFTSLPCVNCPPVDRQLRNTTEGRNDVTWVAHHVGYRNDEFTLEESRNLIRFGVGGNPYIMVNRTLLNGNTTPAFTIGMLTDEELKSQVFDYAAAQPAFVQLEAKAYAEQNVLTVELTGEGKPFFTEMFPNAVLHIYLIEDQVTAEKPQYGDANKKIHDNILRAVISPARGVLPTWDEKAGFSYTTTFDLLPTWQQNHMRVVAFLTARADASTNYPTGEVLNAVEAKMESDMFSAINATTDFPSNNVWGWYTTDGRKLNSPPTAKGLYIKKGTHARKVLIK